MTDSVFPERFFRAVKAPTPVVRVVRREPLAAIREILALSIDDVVNDAGHKRIVADFYRVTRAVENEAWLRRHLRQLEDEAWVAAHL